MFSYKAKVQDIATMARLEMSEFGGAHTSSVFCLIVIKC